MPRLMQVIFVCIALAGCTVARPAPSVNAPATHQARLLPIEAMAAFRRAVDAGDWDAVRAGMVGDAAAVDRWVAHYKTAADNLSVMEAGYARNGRTLTDEQAGLYRAAYVPVAQIVRDDVAVVVVSQRWRTPRESAVIFHPVLMLWVGDRWVLRAEPSPAPPALGEQWDRADALFRSDAHQLVARLYDEANGAARAL